MLSCHKRGTYRIYLVQDLPLLVGHTESLGCLDGSLHLTGPHLQVTDALRLDELAQLLRKLRGEEKANIFFYKLVQSVAYLVHSLV